MSIPKKQGDERLPVTLVTGFLGSGKTTLLSALLRRADKGRIAVIINEFGEIPLDQALIESNDGQVVVFAGGCLCCAVAGDIAATLLDLHHRREASPFDRIVIETSGLADPGPILAPLIQAPELTSLFRVDGVIALVDALQGSRELDRQRISVKQIALADRIILTKSDIAAPRAVARLHEQLGQLNPWAPIVVANHGDVDDLWLFDSKPYSIPPSKASESANGHYHDHDHLGIRSFCLWFEMPLNGRRFTNAISALTDAYGEKILRIKGLLDLDGLPTAIHGVQHFLHPAATLPAWPDPDTRSRIVFITDHLEEAAVRPFFSAF
jgi:G3E family GTPase